MVDVSLYESFDGSVSRIENSILVQLAYCAARGVKVRVYFAHIKNGNVFGQPRANGMMKFSAVQLATRTKVAHLARGVNARVGASAANEIDGMPDGPPDSLFDDFLDGSLARLRLPPVKIGTVVSYLKTNVAMHATIVTARATRG